MIANIFTNQPYFPPLPSPLPSTLLTSHTSTSLPTPLIPSPPLTTTPLPTPPLPSLQSYFPPPPNQYFPLFPPLTTISLPSHHHQFPSPLLPPPIIISSLVPYFPLPSSSVP